MSKYAIGKTSNVGRTNQRLKNKRVANVNQSLMNQGVANKVTWGGMFPKPFVVASGVVGVVVVVVVVVVVLP